MPILADNNAERLTRAKKSGIYYTFPNDETLKNNVSAITGGKMADGAVYLTHANRSEPSVLFPLVKRDAFVAFCATTGKSLPVNLEYAMKNNVTIKGITENREFVSTTICPRRSDTRPSLNCTCNKHTCVYYIGTIFTTTKFIGSIKINHSSIRMV